MKRTISIAIIDDEVLFREGISRILAENHSFIIKITAQDGTDFLKQLSEKEQVPDIALIDIKMSPMDGFETVSRLNIEYPSIKTIILSSFYQEAFIGHMIKLGVAAFLPKNAKREILHEAIEQVYISGVYFTPKDHEMLRMHIQQKSANHYFKSTDQLSNREIEVLTLICKEHTNQEIADHLFISKRTVESHRVRIMEKLDVKNTAGMVVYAITQEIYKPESHYYF